MSHYFIDKEWTIEDSKAQFNGLHMHFDCENECHSKLSKFTQQIKTLIRVSVCSSCNGLHL